MIENKIPKELQEKIERLKKEAEGKISKPNINLKKLNDLKELGRKQGKEYDSLAKCYDIDEEFKKNPPILYSSYVNGILVEQYYEKSLASKVEFLIQNKFRVRRALHSTHTYGIIFSVFGKAYINRNGKKIFFDEKNNPKTFLLKDGDVIGTEKNSYFSGIKEGYSFGEKYRTEIFVYPESEMRIYLDEKTTNSEHSFIDPKKVDEVMRKKSKTVSIIQKIKNIELIKGIFNIEIRRDKVDSNNLLKIDSKYPRFSFKPYSNLIERFAEFSVEKIIKENPNISAEAQEKMRNSLKKSSPNICENISAIIELCEDNSVVITKTPNLVKHEGIGKETRVLVKSIEKPMKITLTKDALYETDTEKYPDERVFCLVKIPEIPMYYHYLEDIKEINEKLKELSLVDSSKELKKMIDDANEMLEGVKKTGDKELIKLAEDELDRTKKYNPRKTSEANKEALMIRLKHDEEQIRKLKPLVKFLENGFPPYSRVRTEDMA